MNQNVNTRNIILDALIEINEKDRFTHIVLPEVLKKYQYLDNIDRSFISRTILGTVERKITLDYIINLFSKTPVNKMKPVIRNILRMSTYQLIYMEGVKDFAVCNEAVRLSVKKGFTALKGFVNGVLRTIARKKNKIEMPQELWLKYSTPRWIVDKWLKEYGKENTEAILKAQYSKRPLTVRCNFNHCTREELVKRLTAENVRAKVIEEPDCALEIEGFDYLNKLNTFANGDFFVQDLSSMMVCYAINPEKDSYVIDLCAAPGGKSLHIAEFMDNTGFVEARDVSDNKVMMINENIDRLNLCNIKAVVKDATVKWEDSVEKADVVIADLPCSGLGILNKKPDIKYHASEEKCHELSELQKKILDNSKEYVKHGGKFCFSTCTLNYEENMGNVEHILSYGDYVLVDFEDRVPDNMKKYYKKGILEIIPDENNNFDGFFIALFRRK